MLTAFTSNILDKKLFSKDQKLLVAVSGGVDSVVLIHIMDKTGYNFSIAHCNFKLRGAEAEKDEKFVENLSKKMNVDFFVNRFNTKEFAKKNKLSIQMAARKLRYDWFQQLISEKKFDYLLTAHHLNDNIETLLLNLTRGTGLQGLTGIPEKQNEIVRPLLIFSRNEIEQYAKENKIRHREDSSNYEEKYARNLIRAKVIPALKKINPSLEKTFQENIHHLQQSENLLKNILNEKRARLLTVQNGEIKISLPLLEKEKDKDLLLFEILSEYGFSPGQLVAVGKMTGAIAGKKIESEKYILITGRNEIIIRKKVADNFGEIEIKKFPAKTKNPSLSFEIKENKNFSFPADKNVACVDREKVGDKVTIRKWKQGDRFHPFGMKGTKKLSDYFVSEKMSLFEKQEAFVITANNEIVWIVGKRIDARYAVNDATKKILIIRAE